MPPPVFVSLAAAMVIAAVALVVMPLTRNNESAPISAGIVVALLPLGVALLYFSYSNWRWDQPAVAQPQPQAQADAAAPSVDEMVAGLEQRLQSNPDDVEGWLMLGRSYVVLSRFAEAVTAYGRARQLSDDQNVHAITGYAEALAMTRGGVIDDEGASLFDRALAVEPGDAKALWYGGLAAMERNQPAEARARWQRLLDANPPEEMAQVLREQIAAATQMLGSDSVAPAAPVVTAAVAGLNVNVSLATELAGRVGPDVPVFVLARQIDTPGPPLAVVRLRAADLPLQLMLSDADAMVPGRVLSAHDNVEVVARVALGGTPVAQSGDLSGSRVSANTGQVEIVIDSIVNP